MSKDKIFAVDDPDIGSFEFSDAVAKVFPDMLRRSIPGYTECIQTIGMLAARCVQPDTRCYDLGCSLGAAALAMRRNIRVPGCSIIAVDQARAMIERFHQIVAEDDGESEISIIEADVRDTEIEQASMVVMNYTLQFLPLEERANMVRKIYDGMVDGGIFFLSEKVFDENSETEATLVDLYYEFKRRNAYSELEISRKRTALENVLIPETIAMHEERLSNAGFRNISLYMKHLNFVSIVATR